LLAPAPAPVRPGDDLALVVRRFRFEGNTRLDEARLAEATRPWLGRPLRFADLQDAAAAVAQAYERAGWLVRVVLPRQDVTDGVVTIAVVEAVFGGLRLDGQPTRVSPGRLRAVIEGAQPVGEPLSAPALDRAMRLVEELPGVRASGRLVEGREQGRTELALSAVDAPLATGRLAVDNAGAHATGRLEASAALVLASPLRLAERWQLDVSHARGDDYLHAGVWLPAPGAAWRFGASASAMGYRLVESSFASLQAHGSAHTVALQAEDALVRSAAGQLTLTLQAGRNRFENAALGVETSNYRVTTLSAGLDAGASDDVAGGGTSRASVVLVAGRVDLAGSPNQAADAASGHAQGGFARLRFALAREQALGEGWSLAASLSGQWAGKDLDSSERMSIGGPGAVRAFPSDDGAGDQALVLSAELRKRLGERAALAAFLDWGRVQVDKRTGHPGAPLVEAYALGGLGVAADWSPVAGIGFRASAAQPLSPDPAPSADAPRRLAPLLTLQLDAAF
ncbi:MAG TPA: ShlB/FhaC/HecB family hemolysin secretion/activation protein, partial [Burkholderiaceae bacterium]